MPRTRIFLNPSCTLLTYPQDSEHVHISCDTALAPFSFVLPSISQCQEQEFIVYNNPSIGDGNALIVNSRSGQLLEDGTFARTLAPFDSVTFVSDMRRKWLVSDISGAGHLKILNLATNIILSLQNEYIRCTGTVTLVLPQATGSGKLYYIKNTGSGTITVTPHTGDLINGAASLTIGAVGTNLLFTDGDAHNYALRTIIDVAPGAWDILN
jgi:hypothetical protein